MNEYLPNKSRRDSKTSNDKIELLQEMYPLTLPDGVVPEKPYDLILRISEYIENNTFIGNGYLQALDY